MQALVTVALAAALQGSPGAVLSVVLEGGTVYDGSGAAPFVADVGLSGDRVVAIGDLGDHRAAERLDVTGLAVVPGFIDTHSHAVRGIHRHPLAENYIRQGVDARGGRAGRQLAAPDRRVPRASRCVSVRHQLRDHRRPRHRAPPRDGQ